MLCLRCKYAFWEGKGESANYECQSVDEKIEKKEKTLEKGGHWPFIVLLERVF